MVSFEFLVQVLLHLLLERHGLNVPTWDGGFLAQRKSSCTMQNADENEEDHSM